MDEPNQDGYIDKGGRGCQEVEEHNFLDSKTKMERLCEQHLVLTKR